MSIATMPWDELLGFALAIAGAGIVSGLLAGVFGIGGGAVLVPVFYQVLGLLDVPEAVRMHLSVGSSLAIIVPTSLRSFLAHRARGAVDESLLRDYLVPVPLGVILASITAAFISSGGLRVVFAVLTLIFGLRMLFDRESWRLGPDLPPRPARMATGGVIGYFSTLMGIGGGIMNNTFMTLYSRPIHQAVATSAGVGVLIAIPGVLGYIWAGWGVPGLPPASTGYVNWIMVALIIPIAMIVTPWGVALAHRLGKRQMNIGFGLFCLFVSARFFVSLVYG